MFLVIYELLDYILCVSVLFWANCVLNQRSCRRKMNRTEREEVVSSIVQPINKVKNHLLLCILNQMETRGTGENIKIEISLSLHK